MVGVANWSDKNPPGPAAYEMFSPMFARSKQASDR